MKKNKTIILLCSLSFVTTSIGYGAWSSYFQYEYSENNKVQERPVAYIIGKEDVKYTSIEKALDVAQSGDIVTLVPPTLDNYHPTNNKIIPDNVTYEITRNCLIKPGVTLILPTDKENISTVNSSNLDKYINSMKVDDRSRGEIDPEGKVYANKASYGNFADSYSDNRYLRVTVRIKSGVKLTNQGNLIISGYLSSGANANTTLVGQTSHSYSQIVLEQNASIVQNNSNSNLHCYGFIKEDSDNNGSHVVIQQGKILMPLVLKDYKGFVTTSGIEDAINKEKCSPFNQFLFMNIKPKFTINYEASMFGVINIFMYQDGGTLGVVNQIYNAELPIIGKSAESVVQFNDANYSLINAKYNKNDSIDLDIFGGCKLNGLKIKIEIRNIPKTLNTANGFLPISYQYNINLYKSPSQTQAVFDITNQRIKLLPGSKMRLNDGVLLNGNELITYSAFFDGSKGSVTGHNFSSGAGNYPIKDGATLICLDNSKISMNNLAGVIYSDNLNNISYKTGDTIISKEPWTTKQSGVQYVTGEYVEIKEKLSVYPISFLERKKIFVGNVRYADPDKSSENYPCAFDITNSEEVAHIDNYQGVCFFDGTANAAIKMIKNISKIKKSISKNGKYQEPSEYSYNESVSSEENFILYSVSSDISISNDLNGVNEFETQSINIKSNSPQIDGKDPLYVQKKFLLIAEVIDIAKVYDKKIIWSSSDESIATVNQSGEVTGVSLGPVTIFASCGNKIASYETEVIEADNLIGVSKAIIKESSNNSDTPKYETTKDSVDGFAEKTPIHGEYKASSGETKFILQIEPSNAQITSITREYKVSNGKSYMKDYNGNKVTSFVDNGSLSTTIVWDGYTNASPDGSTITAIIKDINNKETRVIFNICHSSGIDIGGCFIANTNIIMQDGTIKKVQDLVAGDLVKTFNHFTGLVDNSNIIYNAHVKESEHKHIVVALKFDDDTLIEIVDGHGFFDCTQGCYVIIDEKNFKNFIGHEFLKIYNNKSIKIKLIEAKCTLKKVRIFSPVTAKHMNLLAENILTLAPEAEFFICMFKIFDNLKYKEDLVKDDVKKYGLFDYEELSQFVNKEVFDAFNLKYMKIAIGKGLISYDEFMWVINKYINDVNEFNNFI